MCPGPTGVTEDARIPSGLSGKFLDLILSDDSTVKKSVGFSYPDSGGSKSTTCPRAGSAGGIDFFGPVKQVHGVMHVNTGHP